VALFQLMLYDSGNRLYNSHIEIQVNIDTVGQYHKTSPGQHASDGSCAMSVLAWAPRDESVNSFINQIHACENRL